MNHSFPFRAGAENGKLSRDGTYDLLKGMQKQQKIFYSLGMNHSSPFNAGGENGKVENVFFRNWH